MPEAAKKASVPQLYGRFPFESHEKKPAVLKPENDHCRFYGNDPHSIPTRMAVSTDRLHAGEFSVPPGGYFDPPDIHIGDEVYYVERGQASVFNPETGQVYQLRDGDFFYIPAGTWHQVYNFGKEEVVFVNFVAPQLWSDADRGASIAFEGQPAYYQGEESELEE